jgi:hypothetical protein
MRGGTSGDLGRGSWAQEVTGDDSGASVSVIVVDAAPGGAAYGFVNSGGTRLVQVDVHVHPRYQTGWLD